MSEATADIAIFGEFDRAARIKQLYQEIVSIGTRFWERVDDAEDEAFENIVKGQGMTDLDAAIAAGAFGFNPAMVTWFDLHQAYLAYLGFTGDAWNDYLNSRRIRVPYDFAELYFERYSRRLDPQYVFPKGTWAADIGANATAGLHEFATALRSAGTWAVTPGAGALLYAYGAVILVSDAGSTATAATVACVPQSTDTPKTITVNPDGGDFSADAQEIVGIQIIASEAEVDQDEVEVAATGQFTEGDYVLLVSSDFVTQELCLVESITANTKLVMADNLKATFDDMSFVIPLFTDATIDGVTGGADTNSLELYARPDRAIAL